MRKLRPKDIKMRCERRKRFVILVLSVPSIYYELNFKLTLTINRTKCRSQQPFIDLV